MDDPVARAPSPTRQAPVIPVSLLVSSARLLLERHLGLAWISGEISGFTRAASGHCYFTLKDATAQVRCVLFRQKAQGLGVALTDGLAVEVRATPTIYESRGDFQLNVETVRLAGLGALYERFVRLKVRLEAARLLLYRAAWRLEHTRSASLDASITKLFVSEALLQSALDTVQIHGGYGYMTEYDVERTLRDAVASTIYSGTSEMQRNIIARWLGL